MEKTELASEPKSDFSQARINLLASDSIELTNYIDQLALEAKQTNPKSLCVKCWCFLSYAQKNNHPIDHVKEGVKPANKYANMSGFTTFAIENGHYQELEDQIYFEKIKSKPPTFIQNKKTSEGQKKLKSTKMNNLKEEAQKNFTPIPIKLEKKTILSEEINSNTQQKLSKKRPYEVILV